MRLEQWEEMEGSTLLYGMQKTEKFLLAQKIMFVINEGINLGLTCPPHRLLHCIHVSLSFPQLPFSVPSIFNFSQQYLSDAITSEAEQNILSVVDTTCELLKMFAGKFHLKTTSLQCYQFQNCAQGSQFSFPQTSMTHVHFSRLLI